MAALFYETVWNLRRVETRNDARYFRGTGLYHHILGLHRGAQPAVLRIVFDVADRRGVDALHRAVTAAGCAATAPASLAIAGGGYGFGCKDPDGRNLAFVCEAADHADAADRPDRPRKIVHINLNARDYDGSLRFFTDTLGFRVIDENAPLSFLHCANADHCSIVMANTKLPTLNHIAFDLPELDSVMRGMGRMKDNGYPIEWGPGRHGPGNNVFALRTRRGAARICRRGRADRRRLRPARLRLLEIRRRPFRTMGHHGAALGALLPRAAAVRLHGGRRPGDLTCHAREGGHPVAPVKRLVSEAGNTGSSAFADDDNAL